MVLDGPRPVAHVAKELGIHDTTLGNWVNTYRRTRGDDVAPAQSAGEKKSERELALERENRKLREENEATRQPHNPVRCLVELVRAAATGSRRHHDHPTRANSTR